MHAQLHRVTTVRAYPLSHTGIPLVYSVLQKNVGNRALAVILVQSECGDRLGHSGLRNLDSNRMCRCKCMFNTLPPSLVLKSALVYCVWSMSHTLLLSWNLLLCACHHRNIEARFLHKKETLACSLSLYHWCVRYH